MNRSGNPSKLKTPLMAMLILSAVAWVNALYSLIHRQGLLTRGLEEQSFCNIGKAFNCDAVALSSYSAFLGLPIAAYGMIYAFGALALTLWAYFSVQDGKHAQSAAATSLLAWVTGLTLVPTAVLAGLSVVAIKTICLLCLFTYALHIGLFACAWAAKREAAKLAGQSAGPLAGLSKVPQALWITLAAAAAVHLFVPRVVESSISEGPSIDEATVQAYVSRHLQSPIKSVNATNAPSIGPADAPVTIVEYSDYQCPHCRHAAMTLPAIIAPHAEKIRLVFKNFPLDSTCNPTMESPGHPLACPAAKTGQCVFKLRGNDAFWKYNDTVFRNQDKLSLELIRQAGLDSGLGADALNQCVNDPATHQSIVDQTLEGRALGIEGTPAIYVNGRFVETGSMPKILRQIVESQLAGK